MARTLKIDTAGIRSDLLAYLRTPGFKYFTPRDVANYQATGTIVVPLTDGDCVTDLVFNCKSGCVTSYDRCGAVPGHARDPAYWDEVNAIGAEFASISAARTTITEVRRRDPSLPTPF